MEEEQIIKLAQDFWRREEPERPDYVFDVMGFANALLAARSAIAAPAQDPVAPWLHHFDVPDALADKALSASVPGGSSVRDWFLPHESDKAATNVRDVMKCALLEVMPSTVKQAAPVQQEPVAVNAGSPSICNDDSFMAALDGYMDAVTHEQRNTERRIKQRLAIFAAADAWCASYPQASQPQEAGQALADEQIRFRFFKDLNDVQRLAVFKAFGVYPDNCNESLNHGIERRLLDAILKRKPASQAAPVVPEGWKLVPIEPTPEMLDAYCHGLGPSVNYRDMLAAAPKPEA